MLRSEERGEIDSNAIVEEDPDNSLDQSFSSGGEKNCFRVVLLGGILDFLAIHLVTHV